MSDTQKNKIAAVIDIGSAAIKMRISQSQKDGIVDLDYLEYPLPLGHDVYTNKKISMELIREIIQVLNGFCDLMKEYGVTQHRVVASSALREAGNRIYVLDQIRIQNGLTVDILEDIENKSLIFNEAAMALEQNPLSGSGALIGYVGEGSIGVAVYDNHRLSMTQNMKSGSIRLSDMFSEAAAETDRYDDILEEYSKLLFDSIKRHLKGLELSHLIMVGNESFLLARILRVEPKNSYYKITKKKLFDLWQKLRGMSEARISEEYGVTEEQAEQLCTSLAIYAKMSELVSVDTFYVPVLGFWDSIIRTLLSTKKEQSKNAAMQEHSMACAQVIAKKYGSDKAHYTRVCEYASKMFSKLKSLHGLGPGEKLLLTMACTMEECGKFINIKNFEYSSYQIIRHTSFIGLSKKDKHIVALITRYRSLHRPEEMDGKVYGLSPQDRLTVAKLNAIFRLADALDRSHRQRIGELSMSLSDTHFQVLAHTEDDLLLETWSFKDAAVFFENVYGIRAELVKRSHMI